MATTALNELFAEIESVDFSAQLSPANDLYCLTQLMANNPAFSRLVLLARVNIRVAREVREEAEALLAEQADPNYLHPHDRAIAAYLFALQASNIVELVAALKAVYNSQPPNLWWTYRAYNHLLKVLPSAATSYEEIPYEEIQISQPRDVSPTWEAQEHGPDSTDVEQVVQLS